MEKLEVKERENNIRAQELSLFLGSQEMIRRNIECLTALKVHFFKSQDVKKTFIDEIDEKIKMLAKNLSVTGMVE